MTASQAAVPTRQATCCAHLGREAKVKSGCTVLSRASSFVNNAALGPVEIYLTLSQWRRVCEMDRPVL